METLRRRTRRMFAFGKGILGLDAGPNRFAVLPDPDELAATISAVVLAPSVFSPSVFSPSVFSRDPASGLLAAARAAGVLVGTRADRGSEPLGAGEGRVTTGLDGLVDRLDELREHGARFAVWTTAEADPSAPHALTANAQAAARFGYAAQRAGLVPLIRVGGPEGSRGAGAHGAGAHGARAHGAGAHGAAERACAQAAALVSLCVHLEDLDVDLAATVLVTEPAPGPRAALAVADPLAMLPSRLGGVALVTTARSPRGIADSVADGPGSPGSLRIGDSRPWPVTFYLGWPADAGTPPTRIDQRSAHVQDRRRRSRG
jgi:fructose-bisphosphate aldolase class I